MLNSRFLFTFSSLLLFGAQVLAAESRQFIFYSAGNDTSIVRVYDDFTKLMHFERCFLGDRSSELLLSDAYRRLSANTSKCERLSDNVQLTDDVQAERFDLLLNFNINQAAGPVADAAPSKLNDNLRVVETISASVGVLAGALRYSLHVHSNRFADHSAGGRGSARTMRMASISSGVFIAAFAAVAGIETYIFSNHRMKESSIEELLPLALTKMKDETRLPIVLTPEQRKMITPDMVRQVLEKALNKAVRDFNTF